MSCTCPLWRLSSIIEQMIVSRVVLTGLCLGQWPPCRGWRDVAADSELAISQLVIKSVPFRRQLVDWRPTSHWWSKSVYFSVETNSWPRSWLSRLQMNSPIIRSGRHAGDGEMWPQMVNWRSASWWSSLCPSEGSWWIGDRPAAGDQVCVLQCWNKWLSKFLVVATSDESSDY